MANPNHVIDSLWVERWKPTDEGTDIAKSRWCAAGSQDPDIHEIERAAPTPSDLVVHGVMQAAASRRWSVRFRDVSQAFSQSKKSNRRQPLACRQPHDGGCPGGRPGHLLLLQTEVCGLVSALAWWRTTFVDYLVKEMGYVINRHDRCALTLPPRPGEKESRSIVLIEMDDSIDAGEAEHQ